MRDIVYHIWFWWLCNQYTLLTVKNHCVYFVKKVTHLKYDTFFSINIKSKWTICRRAYYFAPIISSEKQNVFIQVSCLQETISFKLNNFSRDIMIKYKWSLSMTWVIDELEMTAISFKHFVCV